MGLFKQPKTPVQTEHVLWHTMSSFSSLMLAPAALSATATSSCYYYYYYCPMARSRSVVQTISNPSDRRTGLLAGVLIVVAAGIIAGVLATAASKMFDVATMPAFASMPGTSMSSSDIAWRSRRGGPRSLDCWFSIFVWFVVSFVVSFVFMFAL
jgi:hypothetical protein